MRATVERSLVERRQSADVDLTSWIERLTQRMLLMDRTVDALIESTKAREFWPELYRRADRVLDTLALPKSERRLASRRLKNAVNYAKRAECGAAAIELRTLRGQLASVAWSPA